MRTFRDVYAALSASIAKAWGARAAYDFEMRTGLVGELSELWRSAGEVAWDLGVAEVLAGPRPGPRDVVATRFIVAVKAAARVAPQAPVVTPTATLGRYERALLALLGPCEQASEVQ